MKIKIGDRLKITDKYGQTGKYTYVGKADEFYCKSGFIRKLKVKGKKDEYVIFPESYYKECTIEIVGHSKLLE